MNRNLLIITILSTIISCGDVQHSVLGADPIATITANKNKLSIFVPSSTAVDMLNKYLNEAPSTAGKTWGVIYNSGNDYNWIRGEAYNWRTAIHDGSIHVESDHLKAAVIQSAYVEGGHGWYRFRRKVAENTAKFDGKIEARLNLKIKDWQPSVSISDPKTDWDVRHNLLGKIGAFLGGLTTFILYGDPNSGAIIGGYLAETVGHDTMNDALNQKLRKAVDKQNEKAVQKIAENPLKGLAAIAVAEEAEKLKVKMDPVDVEEFLNESLRFDIDVKSEGVYISFATKSGLKQFVSRRIVEQMTPEQREGYYFLTRDWLNHRDTTEHKALELKGMVERYLPIEQDRQQIAGKSIAAAVKALEKNDFSTTDADRLQQLLAATQYAACQQPDIASMLELLKTHIGQMEQLQGQYLDAVRKVSTVSNENFDFFKQWAKDSGLKKATDSGRMFVQQTNARTFEPEQCEKFAELVVNAGLRLEQQTLTASASQANEIRDFINRHLQQVQRQEALQSLRQKFYGKYDKIIEEFEATFVHQNISHNTQMAQLLTERIKSIHELQSFAGLSVDDLANEKVNGARYLQQIIHSNQL